MDKNHAVWQYLQAVFKLNKWEDWQQIEVSHIIAMTSQVQIGMAVCAPQARTLCDAQFDQVALAKQPNGGVSATISQSPEFIENENEP
jgi:hypothetical protein